MTQLELEKVEVRTIDAYGTGAAIFGCVSRLQQGNSWSGQGNLDFIGSGGEKDIGACENMIFFWFYVVCDKKY